MRQSPTRHERPLASRLLALVLLAVLGTWVVAGAAHAAVSAHGVSTALAGSVADAGVCVKPEKRDDDTIHIQGCLVDTRDGGRAAVPGVAISVEEQGGAVVGTQDTDETGIFDITLPGSAIDVLGKTFVIKIDTDTLPEGTELRNPDNVEVTQLISLQSDAFISFPIGELPEGTGTGQQALQLLVGGLIFALILAMASLGLSMIFGTTGLTNFAHGELVTFGAMAALFIDALPGTISLGGVNITIITAAVFAVIAGGVFGLMNDKMLWGPLRKRGTGLIAMMVVSIGLSIFLRSVYQYFAGGDNKLYSQYAQPDPIALGPVSITSTEIGVIITAVVVLTLVTLALQRTKLGKATRAVADNPALASSSGINVNRVILAVWIVGAALAALAGVFLGMTQGFDFQIGFKILLLIFAATTLGGLGTAWGAIVGALVIGIFIEISTLIVPAELKFVGALVVLILVLLVRPQGLLGRAQRIG